jgi:hypothetical protein
MGLFGWSSSPSEDMDQNVGLHDTRAALEWTQKYISRFGGDPERITALGISSGAAMINLLLVAKGGQETLPFNQVSQSLPGSIVELELRNLGIYGFALHLASPRTIPSTSCI